MPQIALLLCFCFIFVLWRWDVTWRKGGFQSLWIPGAWIAIQGSRPVPYWFGGGGGSSEGSPINTLVFATLIGSAFVILSRRGFAWRRFFRENKALCYIYGYFLLSLIWSDLPLNSLKRLFRDFGCIPVALLLLYQANPAEAVRATFVRVSYILFPLSVVFIKFFPNIGRSFSRAGEAMFGGVTTQKNSLGEVVFVFSVMVLWDLFEIKAGEERKGRMLQMAVRVMMLLMGIWLLKMCDSQTSLLCLLVGGFALLGVRRLAEMKSGRRLLITILTSIVCVVILDKTLGVSDAVIRALGRDPSLTGRTDIWRLVLEQNTGPFLGEGFYVFWDSDKGKAVGDAFMLVNSAHNGYLDLYMDGGFVAGALLLIVLLAAGRRVINRLFSGHPLGQVGVVYWGLVILYNFSESSFFRLDVLWFTFLLVIIEFPQRKQTSAPTLRKMDDTINWANPISARSQAEPRLV